MGVVIEICVKYSGGRTRITVTDIGPFDSRCMYNTGTHGSSRI
jgi:hypothetical protein